MRRKVPANRWNYVCSVLTARARDFAQDLRDEGVHPGRRILWPLILTALRASFPQDSSAETPNADLNLRIAAAILACFPGDLFDSAGQFQALWLIRLNNSAADAQVMLDELLGASPADLKHQSTAPLRSFNRPRRS